jgi:hypothetical protein
MTTTIIDQLSAELNALPELWTVPPGAQIAYAERRKSLIDRLYAARASLDLLAEVTPEIANLTKWVQTLRGIRQECCVSLEALPANDRTRPAMSVRAGLRISIAGIDGQFDFANEGYPCDLLLFMRLNALGYSGPKHAPWNPLALLGSLPAAEERLARLVKRRDEAQATLDSLSNAQV